MSVPMDHNQQDNYDAYMAQPMSPHDHEIDNIPQAQQHHWGTELPTGPQPKHTTDGGQRGDSKPYQGTRSMDDHLTMRDKANANGNTSTRSGGKKKR